MAARNEKKTAVKEELKILIPFDVMSESRDMYLLNYASITKGTGRLMLFAGDQKIEHLNDDFFGPGIHSDDADPEHLFRIAEKAKIGAFASQLGLIARYAPDYPDIPYLVKMNSRTNLLKTSQFDPQSEQLWDITQLIEFQEENDLKIHGVGFTIYPGSESEAWMLRQAAQLIYEAHRVGLVAVLWVYPRGKAVPNEHDPHLIAGAAGLASALGSDFVKVNYPKGDNPAEAFKEAVRAAGRTKVVCAGGPSDDPHSFLQRLHGQIHISGAAGNATGRNIHQKPLAEAVRMCNAIHAITIENKSVDEAMKIYRG